MPTIDGKNPFVEPRPGPLARSFYEKNIPIISLSSRRAPAVVQMGYGYKQKRRINTDFNDFVGVFLCLHKDITKELLKRCGFPVPSGFTETKEENFVKKLPLIEFPIVVKPEDSIWGIGVTTNIKDKNSAVKAFRLAKKNSKMVIAEEFVPGNDYRILIMNNKFIAAMNRVPARVFGDGKKNIRQLVIDENRKRVDILKNNPYSLKPIDIDTNTEQLLESSGKNLDYIPKQKEEVPLKMNSNIKSGGEGIDVTDQVCPENKKLMCYITQIMGLDIAGFDIQARNINQPITKNGGKIIEINSNPDIFMHKFPSQGKAIDTTGILANTLFPNPDQAWIPIYINGKISKDQKIINKYLGEKPLKVIQLQQIGSDRKYIIKKPSQNLMTYLLDPLTTSIYLETTI